MAFGNNDPIYEQIYPYNNMPHAETLCSDILVYLLDLPKPGYTPPDSGCRADIARMLWYDDPHALDRDAHSLPTEKEKKTLIYKANVPTPTLKQAPKGYRLFLQPRIGETQTEQKVELRVFPGETYPINSFTAKQAVEFQILVGMSMDVMDGGISRSYKLVLDIIRALNGVDIGGGVNTMRFDRDFYHYCRTQYFNDGRFNVGYYLTMATEFSADHPNY